MHADSNTLFIMVGRLCLSVALSVGVILVCAVAPPPVFAVTDISRDFSRNGQPRQPATSIEQRDQGPRRILHRRAIDACEGKKEGDPCTINAPRGILEGVCLSGRENIFACRPHRDKPQPEADTGKVPGQPVEPAGTLQPEPKNLSRVESPAKQAEPTVRQPIGPTASNDHKETAASPVQPGSRPPAEQSPVSPLPQAAGPFDSLGQTIDILVSCLVTAMLAAGLTWFAFFKYSTVPLRRLRKVTQRLAGGDLSARVGEGLVHRKSEVVDLGRDVDRMAERIESLVGAQQRLIRDVSHELRSPLARLNVALELARQSAGPVHSAPFDRIERESDRLNELIGQLLMLTKLENDSGAIQKSEIDVAALIGEIVQDADFEARSNDRSVVMSACEPLQLNGNRELLRQALENLVRNAARYTAPGTAVEISLRRKESGGRSWARIEVRDQGPGVPESELYDIFRPFYRVNDARERQSGGAGVGLAISDRAVRLHGGSLRAFNAPGVGLIMEMELPLA